jgi:Domain of unknown function (DUF4276)
MKRGLVLVEGQTEERFVGECLGPYLAAKGLGSYSQVRRELGFLLHDTGASVITTLLDYYALPPEFPGMADRSARSPKDRFMHVEAAWAASVGDTRFVPHLALHEFEAWVYAAPACLEPWMFDDDVTIIAAIAAVASVHSTPEDIDEGRETAPSKRLRSAFAGYQKTLHGPLAVTAIGIDRIRAVCPHFARWLDHLEAIAAAP